ncbi:hypothetical protein E2C01_098204 [Portunus trituberculatus]|uniref:Uncharacterized protein n=1 Tax=Portunus trituberculatus TaxID=210409 RepID=A0A5B7K6H8_PORTR|nr:hypothetical protein [Portunus trituberculatus]
MTQEMTRVLKRRQKHGEAFTTFPGVAGETHTRRHDLIKMHRFRLVFCRASRSMPGVILVELLPFLFFRSAQRNKTTQRATHHIPLHPAGTTPPSHRTGYTQSPPRNSCVIPLLLQTFLKVNPLKCARESQSRPRPKPP